MVIVLIYLDGSIDFPDEPVGGEESDGAGQQPERQHHQAGVAEI